MRSFSIITGVPYDEVYDALAKAGRVPCDGFCYGPWLRRRVGKKVFGGKFKKMLVKGMTVPTFLAKYPKGKYMLDVSDHVFVIIGGVVHDLIRTQNDEILTGGWKFTK